MTTLTRRAFAAASALALGLGLLGPSASADDKLRLVVVTGSTGGVFYPYGGGIAKILSEKGPNVQATAQVTGGSVDNVKLLAAGEADLGFSTLDSAVDGLKGEGAYAEEGAQDVRVIATLYDSYLHVVADAGSGAADIAGLKGRNVGVGSAGSSTEVIADRVMAAAGLDPMADVKRDNLSVAESAGALKDGKIAAFFWIGGVPTSAVKDLAVGGQPKLAFLPVSAETLAAVEAAHPGVYKPIALAPNAYDGQTAEVATLGVANVLLVRADASDEMVTAVLTTLFDNLDAVHAVHPEAAKLTLAGAAAKGPVPLHPAAKAFYKARGVE